MDRLQYLRLFSIAGGFLVGFWLPIRLIGYVPSVALETTFDLMISVVSIVNIYLHFKEHKLDYKRLKNWINLSVLFDLVCAIPLSFFAFVFFETTVESVLLLNLLAARHIRKIKPFLDNFDSLQPITYRLVPLLIVMPLLVHLTACGWIALGSGTAGPDPDKIFEYVKAVYWAFTTLCTVGYGDISAKTIPQMMYACGVQVVGVGVFGYILSNVASLLSRSDAAREHHMDNLDKIETFMKIHYTPTHLRARIRAYYHYLWTHKKGYKDQSLLDGLPAKIQSELFFHINKSIIEKVPFLSQAEDELIEDLMNELEPHIFVPGEKIFRVDEKGDALYFIQSGEVEIVLRDGKKVATLGEGAFFGEMALVSEQPRSATAKANTFCDVYKLQRDAFERVTKLYPEFRHHVEEVVQKRKSA
ncbi:MAG: cyclic nucleotide-binding domain-containing protein [Oligoflexia bacterium]|nr:cyclic nucleotide-binding domain-containing protein [Oligoflexia bacterium]